MPPGDEGLPRLRLGTKILTFSPPGPLTVEMRPLGWADFRRFGFGFGLALRLGAM